jgi:uncharacterized membrane protein YjjB (DUF3815 family)
LIGLIIGLLSLFVGKYQSFGKVFEFVAAGAASALAGALTFVFGAYAVSNATLAGLIVLMPGLTLTIALIELSTRNLSSGTSRLSGAFVIFLSIGFGVAVGGAIANLLLGEPAVARAALRRRDAKSRTPIANTISTKIAYLIPSLLALH